MDCEIDTATRENGPSSGGEAQDENSSGPSRKHDEQGTTSTSVHVSPPFSDENTTATGGISGSGTEKEPTGQKAGFGSYF
jgi:hypothetical protein